ncbi:MAG: prepilin peptidase [Patescibacteria group bacterium]|nr:prepilin peptidase [Patescibacteria group bacterium]
MLHLFFIFISGLILGSFLNVVINRTKAAEPFRLKNFLGRSHCPECGKKIHWFDNIPLLSFFLLNGRCRYCRKKISLQYPLVEFFTAALAVILIYFKFRFTPLPPVFFNLAFFCFFAQAGLLILILAALVCVFVYDLKTFLIPDQFVLFGAFAALARNLCLDLSAGRFSPFEPGSFLAGSATIKGFLAALLASGFFFLLVFFSKEKWMGWGDVKFAVSMGLVLGFPSILVGLFLAFFIGSITGLMLIIKKTKTLKSQIPFGPFLCLGTYLAFIFAPGIIDWYLGYF